MTTTIPDRNPVADVLETLHLAPRQAHKALTVWPLLRDARRHPSPSPVYLPLADALHAGTARLDEVSVDGAVPHARLDNLGEAPVLVLFGEEILGAKQNRIANASFLVDAHASVVLDVSCVEHGRWSRTSGVRFRAGEQVVSHKMRRKMHGKVSRSLQTDGSFDADQQEVWGEVAARVEGAGVASASGAYQDYTQSREVDLASALESFHTLEDQVGFVAAVGDAVVGLELVGSPALLRKLHQRLLRSYAIDAIDQVLLDDALDDGGRSERRLRFAAPEPFLRALIRASLQRAPSLGLGVDLRIEGTGVTGCALAFEGIAHLSAFAEPESV